MDLGLRNTVAVVAASSKGIGKAVAWEFAREGAQVVVNGRDLETVTATADEIARGTHAEVEPVAADMSEPSGPESLIQRAVERFGAVHSLFVNAGGPPSKTFEASTDEDWDQAVDLTLLSSVRLVR